MNGSYSGVGHLIKGRYSKEEKPLGRGGMAVTFRAFDVFKSRFVVIKEISDEWKRDDEMKQRFIREITQQKRLRHSNIVQVLDDELTADPPFAILEYCEKGSIADWVRQNHGDSLTLVRFIAGVLNGVAYIHSRRLVHRDLSPDNMLITSDNVPKVSDFGLCLPIEKLTPQLTPTGETGGKQIFMAPEQWWKFDKVNYRADIYSLGVSFYYILTAGRLPAFVVYDAKDYPTGMLHVYPLVADREKTTPVTDFTIKVPAVFDRIIYEMLAKQEKQRRCTAAGILKTVTGLLRISHNSEKALLSLTSADLDLLKSLGNEYVYEEGGFFVDPKNKEFQRLQEFSLIIAREANPKDLPYYPGLNYTILSPTGLELYDWLFAEAYWRWRQTHDSVADTG